MELDFYLSESKINPSLIKEKWIYPAASGFGPDATVSIHGSGDDPFSLLFTFNKSNSVRGTILSNYYNGQGLTVGFTDNNELFCSSSGEFYIFHSLRLGTKNCLGITRQNSTVTAYQYDVLSSGLNRIESYQFSNLSNLSGTGYSLGRNLQYQSLHGMSGAAGTFDQLLYLSDSISVDPIKKIFSGYLPITFVPNTGYTLESESQERRNIPSISGLDWDTINYNPFVSTMRIINSGIMSTNYQNANGTYQINFTGTNVVISGQIYQTINLCQNTGNLIIFNQTSNVSNNNGTISAIDFVKFNKNEYNEFVFTHSWRIVKSGVTGHVDHDFYQVYKTGLVTGITTDTNYYSAFHMRGIVNRNTGNGYLKLETLNSYSKLKPTGMNNWGLFDAVNLNYYVNGLTNSGQIYYGGSGKLDPQDYAINGERVTPQQINTTYDLVYDMWTESSTTSQQTIVGVATGNFPPYSSLAFKATSDRIIFQDYFETSNLHLINGEGFVYPDAPREIFNNDNRFWI